MQETLVSEVSDTLVSLQTLFENLIGACPAEYRDMFYIICVIFVFFVTYCFFNLLFNVFGVTKWKK